MILTKRKKIIFVVILSILLIPAIAMQFTNEVNWSLFDFLIMGLLLLSVGLTGEYLYTRITNKKTRFIAIVILLIIFLVIWGEMAVGLFNSPIAGS